jgi:hypothetical protein
MKNKFIDMIENGGWITDSTGLYDEVSYDSIVEEVKDLYDYRSSVGIKKYNTTLEESKQDLDEFLLHLQEELMDATLYIQKLRKLNEDAN